MTAGEDDAALPIATPVSPARAEVAAAGSSFRAGQLVAAGTAAAVIAAVASAFTPVGGGGTLVGGSFTVADAPQGTYPGAPEPEGDDGALAVEVMEPPADELEPLGILPSTLPDDLRSQSPDGGGRGDDGNRGSDGGDDPDDEQGGDDRDEDRRQEDDDRESEPGPLPWWPDFDLGDPLPTADPSREPSEPSDPSPTREPSDPSPTREPSEPSPTREPSEPTEPPPTRQPSDPSPTREPSDPTEPSPSEEPTDPAEPSDPAPSEPSEPTPSEPGEPSPPPPSIPPTTEPSLPPTSEPTPPPTSEPPAPAPVEGLDFVGLSENYTIGLLGVKVLSSYTLSVAGEPGAEASVFYGGKFAGALDLTSGSASVTLGRSLLDLGLSNPLIRVEYSDGTPGAPIEAYRNDL